MITKQIPYGISDYERVVNESYYYVDKTMYIEKIEQSPSFLFLIRPRRFGKSLLLSMLAAYYDINYADRFEELFGNQYIFNKPTKDRGKYLILSFNFSLIDADPKVVKTSFEEHCTEQCNIFVDNYAHLFSTNFREEYHKRLSVGAQLQYLAHSASYNNLSIYILIDEYDKFTSTILASHGKKLYNDMTHGAGFYRSFFSVLKGMTTGNAAAVQRMFITGVSPLTMDDLTSGFNIGSNVTLEPQFNDIIGFSEQELRTMLDYFKAQGKMPHTVEEIIETIRPWYNNYCFAEECIGNNMYNSDMVLYYLNAYFSSGEIVLQEMIDHNIKTDYNQLNRLVKLDAALGKNFSVIQELAETGQTITAIKRAFPAEELTDTSNFKSLLFYFGLLSIAGTFRGKVVLRVPNLVVRDQLFRYLIEGYKGRFDKSIDIDDIEEVMENMAYQGEWKPVFELFGKRLGDASVVREFIEGEAHVKGFMLAHMSQTNHYIIYPEYEMAKGYADFYFQPNVYLHPEMLYSYIVEIKYLKRDAKDIDITKMRSDASEQLRRYAADPKVGASLGSTQLRLVGVIMKGWEVIDSFELPPPQE
ncbi:hypothetical protein AwDysgo_14060 [Bacteroidales bacterium]|nr:hypothetical protein AwDysgo_14060 [Bacteroidales bacterium]